MSSEGLIGLVFSGRAAELTESPGNRDIVAPDPRPTSLTRFNLRQKAE